MPTGENRARHKPGGPWISWTGLRLALAFVVASLLSIGTIISIAGATISGDVHRLVDAQGNELTKALALASVRAYRPTGWDRPILNPVLALVAQVGAVAQVRTSGGEVIRGSADFATFPRGEIHRQPVLFAHRVVGVVVVKFDGRGLGAAIGGYEALRWRVRIASAAAAVIAAFAFALLVARRLTAPVDRLIGAARAMESGDAGARVGQIKGVSEVRELSAAFDQMADSIGEEARLRQDMAADLSHELRTPISVLHAGIESMRDGITEPTPDNLAALSDEVVRLTQMADDLRVLSSQRSATLQLTLGRHDLAVVAAGAVDTVIASFEAAEVRLIRRLSPVAAHCDDRRTHEIVVNLLTNAVKFTPAGGHVVLETGLVPRSDDLAMLRVTDTGMGIAPQDLPDVTQRFFRGRRSTGISGSGIGLAIVDQLVKLQHGTLEILSEEGKGTRVTVTLPRVVY